MIALLLAAIPACASLEPRSRSADQANDYAGRLAEQRFADAFRLADAVVDPVQRHLALCRVRARAGDLNGALSEGIAGLRLDPGSRELLLASADLAIVLVRPELALALTERLTRAVGEADGAPEVEDWWRAKSVEYAKLAEELGALQDAREAALGRARVVTLLGLVACSATLLLAGAMGSKKMPP